MTLVQNAFDHTPHKITDAKLITLKLLCKYGQKLIPSNAGMILFGKTDERLSLFPITEISCARFAGTTKAEFGDIKRKDIPEYPVNAIRKVLINPLIHANYETIGSRFFIAFFDDRLEIQNPGNFPPGMTIDNFKNGISKIRNPTIARIFREKEKLDAYLDRNI